MRRRWPQGPRHPAVGCSPLGAAGIGQRCPPLHGFRGSCWRGAAKRAFDVRDDLHWGEGESGLQERSSRPHSCPRRTSPELEQRIIETRTRERRGPDWIGAELGVPARTVSRVLARHQVPGLCMLDPLTGEVIRASKVTAVEARGPIRTSAFSSVGVVERQSLNH